MWGGSLRTSTNSYVFVVAETKDETTKQVKKETKKVAEAAEDEGKDRCGGQEASGGHHRLGTMTLPWLT